VQLRRDVVAPPLILLLYVRLIYGIAPLPPLGPYWISTSFGPTLVIMVLFNNLPEEIGGQASSSPGSRIVTARSARHC